MAILKILFGYIFKFRDFLQNQMGKLLRRLQYPDGHPQAGKWSFIKGKTFKRAIFFIPMTALLILIISKSFGPTTEIAGGVDAYDKELATTTGVNPRDITRGGREDDPFKTLGNSRDQYGQGIDRDRGNGGIISSEDSGPGLSECVAILDKMKANQTLTTQETLTAQACLESNDIGLTPEELAMAQLMLDPNTTAEEKALIAKVLNNSATPEEIAVARALATGTPEERALAKAAVASGNPDAIAAVGRQLSGQQLTAEQQALVDGIRSQVAAQAAQQAAQQGAGTSQIKSPTGANIPVDLQTTPEALGIASQEIANAENQIAQLESAVGQQQLAVAGASEKLAAGLAPTNAENQALQNFTQSRARLDQLKREQEARKTEFARRLLKAQTGLAQAMNTVQTALPTGTFIEYDGQPFDCSKIKPLAVKRPVRKKGPARVAKVVDLDGRELRPEEVEFIKLQRKKAYDLAQARQDANNPSADGLGTPLNVATGANGEPVGVQDLSTLIVGKNAALRNFELTPDMKIPAVLDSQILVSDKGRGQMVRARIIDDVHNPQTNQILIPKDQLLRG